MPRNGDYDRLGQFMWAVFKQQIITEFRHHPYKEEILDRIATSSFIVDELERWFEEAAFYTNVYWNNKFKNLANLAMDEGVNVVPFRKVEGNGEENEHE